MTVAGPPSTFIDTSNVTGSVSSPEPSSEECDHETSASCAASLYEACKLVGESRFCGTNSSVYSVGSVPLTNSSVDFCVAGVYSFASFNGFDPTTIEADTTLLGCLNDDDGLCWFRSVMIDLNKFCGNQRSSHVVIGFLRSE